MKKLLFTTLALLLPCMAFAADIDCDADSNNQMDLSCGGTNADTAAAARTALSVPALSMIRWVTATAYTANNQSVTHGGHVFVCTSNHTSGASTEPGTGADWATVWKYHGSDLYAAALGADDNYVTDAEKTRIGELEAADNVVFGNITAEGGTLKAGVGGTTQGALVLATNTDPIYTAGLMPAAAPSEIVALKFPPTMPGGANYLLNFDADGTGGWTDPATLGGGYTNLTSFVAQTPWKLFYSNTDGDVVELGFGNDGEYLKSNGAALAPSWATPSGAAHDAVTLDTELSAVLSLSTQQITLDSQTANYFWAAPNGSAGDPIFRAIVAADIPTLNQNTTGTAGGLSGTPNITVGTISAGATGFSVDADGDVTAKSYLSSAADGSRRSELPNNTTITPLGGGVEEIYNEAGAIKAVENDTEYDIILSRDFSANGLSLVSAANYASMRGLLDLEADTDFAAYGKNPVVVASKATTYTIGTDSANELFGGTVYVTSATTITAPAVAVGQNFTVVTIGDIAVSLDVDAADKMILDGVTLADGDKATNSSKAGDTITCQYYSADGFYCWSGTVLGGHWTDGN